jgi:DNA-binding MarR family transcriptional regulator
MWEDISFVQGRVRKGCLEALAMGPTTPTEIASKLDEPLSHISRALKELQGKSLVECLTPKMSKNRIYSITEKGKKVLAGSRKLERKS